MVDLYLVRHGRIADSQDPDPGLGAVGRAQADAMAAALGPKGPMPVISSPFRRARETAAPLARMWGVVPRTDERIGEIPMPPDSPFRSHSEWLKYARAHRWPELHEQLRRWRDEVVQALLEIETNTVLVSHFVAINVAIGHALGDDRVTCFYPENCSRTVLRSDGKHLRVLQLGAETEGHLR